MLNNFLTYAVILSIGNLPFGGAAIQQSTKPTVVAPKPTPVLVQSVDFAKPLPQANYPTLKPLSYAALHFAAMGTYSNSYDWGQCTWGAASMKGNIPSSWGNAANWASAARASGILVSNQPIVGAVAQQSRGYYGHVAIVTAIHGDGTITITEMNYDGAGDGLWRTRTASVNEFVYIYI